MTNAIVEVPPPANEPVRSYAAGSPEKASLKRRLAEMLAERVDIPLVIGGREVRTGSTIKVVSPHDHRHVLALAHQAGAKEIAQALQAAREAWKEWSQSAWEDRAAVLLKAADLLAGPWRDTINAATMLGQSKTVYQSEIDAACEMTDFWRFNPHYMRQIYRDQPLSAAGYWDRVECRPLEGFVFAITPFNFTAIGGNLPTAPILMGNVALWKPASTSLLANYYTMKLLEAAGLPPGVLNFLPGRGGEVGPPIFAARDFAGLHFTGSTATFQGMWNTIAQNLPSYRNYPRIVGETGGKDFVFAHPSADANAVATALVRGAFEYQGQKCSAASRAYLPASLWPAIRAGLVEKLARVTMGSPLDFRNFMGAVIDRASFDNIAKYIAFAKRSSQAEIVCGGKCDASRGYYVEPTVVLTSNPKFKLMQEEIFGPVLTIYVYKDKDLDETLRLCDSTSPYALTGAIFAAERGTIVKLTKALRYAAGNFYINDKPTGAIVGQQPFGGARASGTNDKAGSAVNLLRWTSHRTVKETFVPAGDFPYPHMGEE
jgi:1-pyrroline-5-carboxylate dehydrogenase